LSVCRYQRDGRHRRRNSENSRDVSYSLHGSSLKWMSTSFVNRSGTTMSRTALKSKPMQVENVFHTFARP
jgi:hypothetical protein